MKWGSRGALPLGGHIGVRGTGRYHVALTGGERGHCECLSGARDCDTRQQRNASNGCRWRGHCGAG